MSRTRLELIGVSLLAALPAVASGAPAATATADSFVAPASPLHLTRTLRRSLHDGKEIVSVRRYEVIISAEPDGFRVDGHLLDAAVDAPPGLEALAAIERNRPDTGLFPFRLDARGLIASSSKPADQTAIAKAGDVARRMIARSALAERERPEAETVAGEVLASRSAPGAQWPYDLFSPAAGQRSHFRQLALPDGQEGSITTVIDARRNGTGSIIERSVTTDTGGQRRVTRETYELSPRPS